ncbi:sigma-70 family RNA polymerase sigma factor [Synechococcus sp. AH-601-N10]|nr:sigma-70 family RNA polymerase sigma factor [Synechococcus sp. AH-601-N10]
MPFIVNGNIDQFLAEMGRIPLLTASEEIMLGTAVQLGLLSNATPRQKRAGQRAKDRMIKANLRLVVNVSRKYMHRQMGQLEAGDLIQEGCIGLTRAVEKFDPELGYKFSTYAYWWIRQSISRAIDQTASTIRVPTSMHHMLVKLNHLPAGLNEQEVCEHLDISDVQLKNLRHALVAKRTSSLDMKLGSDGDGSTLNEMLCDEQSILNIDQFQWEIVRQRLQLQAEFAVNNDQVLLRRNVVDDESLQSIANTIGISRERVRQKVERAKKQLAAQLIEHRELVA